MISIKKYIDIIRNVIYGCIIGIANIIPGVSGGTMAVMLNIYDKLISSFTGLRKNFKQSMKFLILILVGGGIGIVVFSKLIKYLISVCPLPTCFFFIGLIVGSMPLVFRKALEKKFRIYSLIPLFIFLAGMIVLSFIHTEGQDTASAEFQLSFANWMFLFAASAVAAMCMIIPGVSGSMILMVFGIYANIIGAISDLTKHFTDSVMLLMPVGLGVIFGIVFGAKLIELPKELYCFMPLALLGLPDKSFYSSDYFPLLPWLFLYVCGFFAWRALEKLDLTRLFKRGVPILDFCGKYSLPIYMLHQPLLMGICFLIFK